MNPPLRLHAGGAARAWARGFGVLAALLGLGFGGVQGAPSSGAERVSELDVVWDRPSTNAWGTMPLGNGDVALNAWMDPSGDLHVLVSKSDAWDAHARLLKLNQVRLRLSPSPLTADAPFRQRLNLRDAAIEIEAGSGEARVQLKLWVDAHRPILRLEGTSQRPVRVECTLEPWRTRPRELPAEEADQAETFERGAPVVSQPDVVFDGPEPAGAVAWVHRNSRSVWESTLRHQGMAAWIPEGRDPLLGRAFGGWIEGPGFRRQSPLRLDTPEPVTRFALDLHALTARTESPEDWLQRMRSQVAAAGTVDRPGAWTAHRDWWRAFWDRSWIRVSASDPSAAQAARTVSQAYALQRFLLACAGRGGSPIKFNGSLFTVPVPGQSDPDYRRWGGCYWFQNTRLAYWPMLAAGDLDLMEPLFRMYRDALPLARARTRLHFGHGGAYFPETMHFWGAWHNGGFGWGWDRPDEPPNRALNQYVRFHWSGGLELLVLMLDRQAQAPDEAFLRETLLPHAEAVLEFYASHYPRRPEGKLLLVPAQALETWWETENPTPEIAGLHVTLRRLLALPPDALPAALREAWSRLLAEVPPVPLVTEEGRTRVLPAEAFRTLQNMENAELYAVFPFRVFGVGRPDLETGRETFRKRRFPGHAGWQQDDTQAALLGLAQEARAMLTDRVSRSHPESRFPAFWGPNFDWIPDQTHGGNAMMALQTMLLQEVEGRLLLLPAWPPGWDVEFRLHASGRTVVEGEVREGRLRRLETRPSRRSADVAVPEPWRAP